MPPRVARFTNPKAGRRKEMFSWCKLTLNLLLLCCAFLRTLYALDEQVMEDHRFLKGRSRGSYSSRSSSYSSRSYSSSSSSGSDSDDIIVVFVILIIALAVLCFVIYACQKQSSTEAFYKALTNAKDIVKKSSTQYSAILTQDSSVGTEARDKSTSPTSGKYHCRYFEDGKYLNAETTFKFTPSEDGNGWNITGYGRDDDGGFTITEGFVSSSSGEATQEAGLPLSGKTMNAYWVEKALDAPSFLVLNTGTFQFEDNTFTGGWKACNGKQSRYLGFHLVDPERPPARESARDENSKSTDAPGLVEAMRVAVNRKNEEQQGNLAKDNDIFIPEPFRNQGHNMSVNTVGPSQRQDQSETPMHTSANYQLLGNSST